MGFYIQDDFWEACEDLSKSDQDKVFGALTRLFFTGEETHLKGASKTAFVAFRDRVKLSRTRSEAAYEQQKRKQSRVHCGVQSGEQNGKQNDKQSGVQTLELAPDLLLKREREKENITCKSKEIDTLPTKEWGAFVKESLSAFQEITGQVYSIASPDVVMSLRTIQDAGHSVDDVRRVVSYKLAEWGSDAMMTRYVRPSTLFGSKFEEYLNAAKSDPEVIIDAQADQYAAAF